eukprot:COSAG02_NODE_32055_length_523_cov_0.610849_1_plen_160_part_01
MSIQDRRCIHPLGRNHWAKPLSLQLIHVDFPCAELFLLSEFSIYICKSNTANFCHHHAEQNRRAPWRDGPTTRPAVISWRSGLYFVVLLVPGYLSYGIRSLIHFSYYYSNSYYHRNSYSWNEKKPLIATPNQPFYTLPVTSHPGRPHHHIRRMSGNIPNV